MPYERTGDDGVRGTVASRVNTAIHLNAPRTLELARRTTRAPQQKNVIISTCNCCSHH